MANAVGTREVFHQVIDAFTDAGLFAQKHEDELDNGVINKASKIPANVTKLMEHGTNLCGTTSGGARLLCFCIGFNNNPQGFFDASAIALQDSSSQQSVQRQPAMTRA
jgi:hypothetical protein